MNQTRIFRKLLQAVRALAAVGAALLIGCGNAGTLGADSTIRDVGLDTPYRGNLLYISDAQYLYVYTYPALALVASILVENDLSGLCSDRDGNVFITQFEEYFFGNGQTLEYPHNGEGPIAKFSFPDGLPFGCAVDPTTGSLAVTNYSGLKLGQPGSIGVFKQSTSPRVFSDTRLFYYEFCTYDTKGDLFVDGQDVYFNPVIAELAKGGDNFTDLKLDGLPKSFGYPAGLAWDGKDLAFGDLDSSIVYRLQVSDSTASVVGSLKLRGGKEVEQFTIARSPSPTYGLTLIGPNSADRSVYLWPYPEGGKPTQQITGLDGSFAAVISCAAGGEGFGPALCTQP